MEYDAEIRSLPLSSLPGSSRRLLSDLLNSHKVLPVEDPIKLPRDWHGLASLVNISSEVSSSLEKHSDPTGKVLEIWQQDPTANVGFLLQYLETLDRFDIYDDLIDDLRTAAKNGGLKKKNGAINGVHVMDELLTFDDRPGYKHMYDAFVLYANEDAAFVKEIKTKLSEFEICGKDVLRPGHTTEYAPVIKLMTERCRYIIILYSPEFLKSRDNIYYRDYAQAVSVKSSLNLVPIMYRECSDQLPAHMKFYFWLHFDSDMYDFWDKLRKSLHPSRAMPVEPIPLNNADGIAKKIEQMTPPIKKVTSNNKENSPTTSVRSLDTMSTAAIDSVAITDNLNNIMDANKNSLTLTNNLHKSEDIITVKEDIQDEPLNPPIKKKSRNVFKIFVKPFERKSKKKAAVAVEEIVL